MPTTAWLVATASPMTPALEIVLIRSAELVLAGKTDVASALLVALAVGCVVHARFKRPRRRRGKAAAAEPIWVPVIGERAAAGQRDVGDIGGLAAHHGHHSAAGAGGQPSRRFKTPTINRATGFARRLPRLVDTIGLQRGSASALLGRRGAPAARQSSFGGGPLTSRTNEDYKVRDPAENTSA